MESSLPLLSSYCGAAEGSIDGLEPPDQKFCDRRLHGTLGVICRRYLHIVPWNSYKDPVRRACRIDFTNRVLEWVNSILEVTPLASRKVSDRLCSDHIHTPHIWSVTIDTLQRLRVSYPVNGLGNWFHLLSP